MTITEFLEARIAEDEAAARASFDEPWLGREDNGKWEVVGSRVDGDCYFSIGSSEEPPIYFLTEGQAEHIARHDPARVLAECAAKREIVSVQAVSKVTAIPNPFILRALASVYAEHQDYRQEWQL